MLARWRSANANAQAELIARQYPESSSEPPSVTPNALRVTTSTAISIAAATSSPPPAQTPACASRPAAASSRPSMRLLRGGDVDDLADRCVPLLRAGGAAALRPGRDHDFAHDAGERRLVACAELDELHAGLDAEFAGVAPDVAVDAVFVLLGGELPDLVLEVGNLLLQKSAHLRVEAVPTGEVDGVEAHRPADREDIEVGGDLGPLRRVARGGAGDRA